MSPKESVKNDRVVKLIEEGVAVLGVRGLARAVGISPAIITRYTQGKVGEPSQATLQKIAEHCGVSVAWLRGGSVGPLERLLEGLKIAGIDPATYNKTVADKMGKKKNYWGELVAGKAIINSEHPEILCNFFGINEFWVATGFAPTVSLLRDDNSNGGIVGTCRLPEHIDPFGIALIKPKDSIPFPVRQDPHAGCDIKTTGSIADAAIQEVVTGMKKLTESNRWVFVGRVKPIIQEMLEEQGKGKPEKT